MKELLNLIIDRLKRDQDNTLRDVASATGINTSRVFRLKSGKMEATLSELVALAEFYGITTTMQAEADISRAREEARKEAWGKVWADAELYVAQKYGVTRELMAWRLSDPRLQGVG